MSRPTWVSSILAAGLCCFAAVSACSRVSSSDSAGSAIPQWSLIEELRLGRIDGDGPHVFGNQLSLEATADGTLFVADRQHSEIRVFDLQGRHLRTIGRSGSGPGEFRDLLGIAFDPVGRLWAADFANRRYSIFGSDLELEESRPYLDAFRASSWDGPIDREGALHNYTTLWSEAGLQPVYIRDSGTSRDTLRLPAYSLEMREGPSREGRNTSVVVPFGARPHGAMDDEGHLWFAHNGAFRLYRISYTGDTISVVEREVPRIALDSAEHERAMDLMRRSLARVDAAWVPEYRPAIEGISVDDQERIWVTTPREDGRRGYEVIHRTGQTLAQVELPAEIRRVSRPVVRGPFLFVVVRDELDVPYVVRFRVDAGSSALGS